MTKKPDISILGSLEKLLKKGKDQIAKGRTNGTHVNLWASPVRNQLIKLYGENSQVIEQFPNMRGNLKATDGYSVLQKYIQHFELLIQSIQKPVTTPSSEGGKVFIGHGRSRIWYELKNFLSDRLCLPCDEFNRSSAAGLVSFERLEEMLDAAVFAFLVMTAEDEHSDSTLHARENVIHEAGLFQGKLGRLKAIIVRQDECRAFSNVDGLTEIQFPSGHIKATFEEVRQVLEREGVIQSERF